MFFFFLLFLSFFPLKRGQQGLLNFRPPVQAASFLVMMGCHADPFFFSFFFLFEGFKADEKLTILFPPVPRLQRSFPAGPCIPVGAE